MERQFFRKFPEVLMLDVTMGTNNQGRPLLVSCSPGPDMKTFTPMRSFLPSQCRWVFDWLLTSAIPLLLGEEALRRTQLVLSDGDPKIYGAFDAAKSKYFPNAIHGLCIFHLVTKPLQVMRSSLKALDHPDVKYQLKIFKMWVLSWMRLGGVESEQEYQISRKLMLDWLETYQKNMVHTCQKNMNLHEALKHNSVLLMEFFRTSIEYQKDRWFFPNRKNKLHLQQKATSSLEGTNHTIKVKASKPVAPNMSMTRSVITQNEQCESIMTEMKLKAKYDFEATPTWTTDHNAKELTTMGESLRQEVVKQGANYLKKGLTREQLLFRIEKTESERHILS